MKNYFRVQKKGFTFEQMKNFNSIDGGDGENEGLAVCSTPNGIDGGSKFGGAWEAMDNDDDLVILNGQVVCRIYDGYRIIPTAEVARFSIGQWKQMLADETAYEYEN